ncbi:hypothetical protein KFU94_64080 [Chloroflexi bacterium TSY]|nr:hypothetical protein [Chloroflexi bacterium TSY]
MSIYQKCKPNFEPPRDNDDQIPPTISYVDGLLDKESGTVDIKVNASDSNIVQRVLATYFDHSAQADINVLRSVDLQFDDATKKWRGSFNATVNSRFFIQAVDLAGNIQLATNKGRYYMPTVLSATTSPRCNGYCIYLPSIMR